MSIVTKEEIMSNKKIGVISDTHSLLRQEVISELKDVDLVIHAGDIGNIKIIEDIKNISPVVYVKGNVDKGEWASSIPLRERIQFNELNIFVVHDLKNIGLDPVEEGIDIVISGHSHKAVKKDRHGVIYLNPGSAGPKRFRLPTSMAIINIINDEINIDIKYIDKEK